MTGRPFIVWATPDGRVAVAGAAVWLLRPDLSVHLWTAPAARSVSARPPSTQPSPSMSAPSSHSRDDEAVSNAGRATTVIGTDAGPVPAPLVAVTVTEYTAPLVRPVIVQASVAVVHVRVVCPNAAAVAV